MHQLLLKLKQKKLPLLNELADVVAPARCVGCYRVDTWLCRECQALFRPAALTCIGCGVLRGHGGTCTKCRNQIPLAGVISTGSYSSPLLRRGIHWFKFRSVTGLARPLARLLLDQLTLIAPLPWLAQRAVLVPIPLHARRFRERGFNQSSLLALALGDLTDIPVLPALSRSRMTWTQSKLPKELRSNNLKDAFVVTEQLPRARPFVLLVDDVVTSGATLAAAAEALTAHTSDFRRYWGVSIARG